MKSILLLCNGFINSLYFLLLFSSLDHQGKLHDITYSEHSRGTKFDMTVNETQEFYEAFFKFTKLVKDPTNLVKIKLKAGEMCTLNNRRVFHGRAAYELGVDGKRWAEGAFVDWDALNSKKRILLKDWGRSVDDFQVVWATVGS